MANHMVMDAPELGFIDRRRTTSPAIAATSIGTIANYGSITALRTRLAAISGASFTAARLDTMTINDMIYALKINDDALGI